VADAPTKQHGDANAEFLNARPEGGSPDGGDADDGDGRHAAAGQR
jgi:hypothetical protein